ALKASVKRGRELFVEPSAAVQEKLGKDTCFSCHKDFGRQSTFRYDVWGTFAKPNNFLQGVFRGGRRPVDIYYRVHSGIRPSGMLAFGNLLPAPTKNAKGEVTEAPIWDL